MFGTSRRELSFRFDKSGSARFHLFPPLSFCERGGEGGEGGGRNDRGLDKKARCKLLFFFRSASVDSSGIAKPTNQFAWSWVYIGELRTFAYPAAERVARELVEQHRKERLLVSRSVVARTECKPDGFRFLSSPFVCISGLVDKAAKKPANFPNFFNHFHRISLAFTFISSFCRLPLKLSRS